MKKVVFTLVVSLVAVFTFAQETQSQHKLKYITTAPDGSIGITVTDDMADDSVKLESADDFYKFQILDTRTSEPVYVAENDSKTFKIDKASVAAGTYKLKLYTKNFIITTKLVVSASRKLREVADEHPIAMNE